MAETESVQGRGRASGAVDQAARDRGKVIMQVTDRVSIRLAGHDVFAGTEEQLARKLVELCARGVVSLVTTPNVDQTLALQSDDSFFEAYTMASLRLFDGMPLVLLATLLGADSPRRHTGADLLPLVARMASQQGWTLVIAGGSDLSSAVAAANLRTAHPGANVVSVPFPRLSGPDDELSLDVVGALNEIKADFVFLCLGSPKQEEWFLRWRNHLPPGVYVGAGAAVDFASGHLTRAPQWVQRVSMEWMWRLAHEPHRLARRYLIKGPRFAEIVLRSLLVKRGSGSAVL